MAKQTDIETKWEALKKQERDLVAEATKILVSTLETAEKQLNAIPKEYHEKVLHDPTVAKPLGSFLDQQRNGIHKRGVKASGKSVRVSDEDFLAYLGTEKSQTEIQEHFDLTYPPVKARLTKLKDKVTNRKDGTTVLWKKI